MRTIKNKLVVMMMVIVSTAGFSQERKTNVSVEAIGTKTVVFHTNMQGSTGTKVQLRDVRGKVLHSEMLLNKERVTKKFDLNALPDGKYFLEVENEAQFVTIPMEITENGTEVIRNDEVVINKPVLRQNGELIDIILPEEDTAGLKVVIFDNKSHMIYKESLEGSQTLRRYNLSQLEKGDYLFRISQGGRKFKTLVSVNK